MLTKFTDFFKETAHFCIMTVFQRIRNFFSLKRALYQTIGPAKDWTNWQSLFLSAGGKSKINVTQKRALSIPAYYRAVNLTCEQVASLPLNVYRQNDDGSITEATTHPLHRLLNVRGRPSALYNTFEFFETLVRQAMTTGNGYARVIYDNRGAITEMRLMNRLYEIIEDSGELYFKFTGDPIYYPGSEIIHLKCWSLDGIIGLNPLRILNEALGKSIAEIDFASSFFGNGAHPSSALETEQKLTADQQRMMLSTFNERYGGPENFGKTVLLQGGVKFKKISMDMNEAQYVAARGMSIQDIANITGVPIDLLNAGDKTSTFASAEQRDIQLVKYAIRVWCKRLEDEMNSKLFSSREQGKLFVKFNLDALLRGDTSTRTQYYSQAIANRWMSPNEVRRLEGFNPYEGGDVYENPNTTSSNKQMNDEQGTRETDNSDTAQSSE